MRKRNGFILNYTILLMLFSLSIFYILIISLKILTFEEFSHKKQREDLLVLTNTSRIINYELFLVDKYILEKKISSLESFITKNMNSEYLWTNPESRISKSSGGYQIIFISDLSKLTNSGTYSLIFFFQKIITIKDLKIKITTEQLSDSFYFNQEDLTLTINKTFQIKTLRGTSYY